MKPFILTCTFFLFFAFINIVTAKSSLESPSSTDLFKKSSPTVHNLSCMLKRNKIKSFYNNIKEYSLTFKATTEDNIDTELKDKTWYCYLIASAPLFTSKMYNEIELDVSMADYMTDIHQKSEACLLIEKYIRILHNSEKLENPIKNKIIINLFLPYYAHILNQLKNANSINPYRIVRNDNIQKIDRKDIIYITKEEQLSKILNQVNKISSEESFISSRNQAIKSEIEDLETFFMELLVLVFPNKYTTVSDYIIKSGYSKDEIPNLIDRTVGRSAKTDFLYRGEHRRRHDKLLQK